MYKGVSRVLSPHLQVYKFPLAVFTSILHRLTGIFLFLVSVVVLWLAYAYYFCEIPFLRSFITSALSLGSFINNSFAVILCFSFCFHMVNGLRHLLWDLSLFSDLSTIKSSNFVVLLLSLVMTVFVLLVMNKTLV